MEKWLVTQDIKCLVVGEFDLAEGDKKPANG
jgi:hypothetical protein